MNISIIGKIAKRFWSLLERPATEPEKEAIHKVVGKAKRKQTWAKRCPKDAPFVGGTW